MVRAPCCEKMGLKKGSWTPEEDQILIAYVQQHGHGNWRALPKQAGETDNEIKNVWHTHLKKLVSPSMPSTADKKKKKKKTSSEPLTTTMPLDTGSENTGCRFMSVSPEQSPCDFSSCGATDSSTESGEISDGGKEGSFCSDKFSEIDESFWLEEWSMDDCAASVSFTGLPIPPSPSIGEQLDLLGASDSGDDDFWLRVFMGAGDLQELSQI
ncbi:hypothetical protein BHM03_00048464 [Ensete ventricosum]|nr:hypothetical protein BHM03_00048464 [Ensete ventricosum]